ncbi:DUF3617 domain-containing protein [Natronospira sp.]|uniref:DUF3617 domain-containing protein n=1 Tax=Natronospira sp. TaxID=2024970 RepID=UPI0038736A15
MRNILIAIAALLALACSQAQADTPNIEPGMWEHTNVTTFEGGAMGEQEETSTEQECITQEEIDDRDFFAELDGVEECTITDQNVSSSGMSYSMSCEHESGMSVEMDANMSFHGTTMSGEMHGKLVTPMGEMSMKVISEGERIGDC